MRTSIQIAGLKARLFLSAILVLFLARPLWAQTNNSPSSYNFTTIAGAVGHPGSADGTGAAARFGVSTTVAVDFAGNIFVADNYNRSVRKITPEGIVTTIANGINDPRCVTVDAGGNVYVSDFSGDVIDKITPAGVLSLFAGSLGTPGATDSLIGTNARFRGKERQEPLPSPPVIGSVQFIPGSPLW